MDGKFNLSWHSYTDHLRTMLHEMMKSSDLTDVTLICDDKEYIKAHKVVLSACSPVFKGIISHLPQNNPVIYLRGIKHQELASILQFMYVGETTFYEDKINEILNVAKVLEIKEISDHENDLKTDEGKDRSKKSLNLEEFSQLLQAQKRETFSSALPKSEVEVGKSKKALKVKDINELISAEVNQSPRSQGKNDISPKPTEMVKIFKFEAEDDSPAFEGNSLSKKEDQDDSQLMDEHEEAKNQSLMDNEDAHGSESEDSKNDENIDFDEDEIMLDEDDIEGNNEKTLEKGESNTGSTSKSRECPDCDKTFKSVSNMKFHHRSVHQGVKFSCNKCEFKTTRKDQLKKHTLITHKEKELQFSCNQSDKKADTETSLKSHIESDNEETKPKATEQIEDSDLPSSNECPICDKVFSSVSSSKLHYKSRHMGIRFPCDFCDYQATQQGHLRYHIKTKHDI